LRHLEEVFRMEGRDNMEPSRGTGTAVPSDIGLYSLTFEAVLMKIFFILKLKRSGKVLSLHFGKDKVWDFLR
jgi:hypothetical protein